MTSWEKQENWRLIGEEHFKPKLTKKLIELFSKSIPEKEGRNDIYIYQTLLYPPKSTPPKHD